MTSAEIITIGTELLLGEIQDTNTRYLARLLRDHGIDIYRTTTVGDNKFRVAQVIRESMQRAQIVITTGGLGPTVDDPTREAVALAIDTNIIYSSELWEQIIARFQRYGKTPTENNKRQAYIPEGAIPVENPVGTAPAFIFDNGTSVVIALPGVPREMEYLSINAVIPYLKQRFDLHGIIKARVLHSIGIGESQVDDIIGDLETYTNPTVGLLAHPGQVDIRITAKAETDAEADAMIADLENVIRDRLGDDIYGVDDENIGDIVSRQLNKLNWKIDIFTFGIDELSTNRLKEITNNNCRVIVDTQPLDEIQLQQQLSSKMEKSEESIGFACSLLPGNDKLILHMLWSQSGISILQTRTYGGPPSLGSSWSVNQIMEFIRRKTIDHSK